MTLARRHLDVLKQSVEPWHRATLSLIPLLLAVVWASTNHHIWSVLPIGFCLTLGLLLLNRRALGTSETVVASIVAALLYRGTIWLATPSMIGQDPDVYAAAVYRVSTYGGLQAIPEMIFYKKIPLFITFNAAFSNITGVSADTAIQFTAVVLFSAVPVLVVAQILSMFEVLSVVKTGSILAAGLNSSMVFAALPIPNGLMIILWFVSAMLIIAKGVSSKRVYVFVVFLIFSMALIHKLGAIVPFMALSLLAVLQYLQSLRGGNQESIKPTIQLILITFVILSLQMFWLTDWGQVLLTKLELLFIGQPAFSTPGPQLEGLEVTRQPLVDSILFERAHWVVSIGLAGLMSLWMLYTRCDRRTTALVAMAGAGVVFMFLAMASPFSLSGRRAIPLGEIFFVTIIVLGVGLLGQRFGRTQFGFRTFFSIVVIILLVSQLAVSPATPDHPKKIQDYLSEPEISAKQYGNEQIPGDVYAPYFVANEQIVTSSPNARYVPGSSGEQIKGWRTLDIYMLNGSVARDDRCVLWRDELRYARFGDIWILEYNPEKRLAKSGKNLLYSNPDARIYC